MVTTSQNERRQFKRVGHSEAVEFQYKSDFMGNGSLSCDLSESGIRLTVNDFVALGTEMFLQIRLGAENFVSCNGRVVWVRQLPHSERYQLGVEFMDTSSVMESRGRIRRLVEQPVN